MLPYPYDLVKDAGGAILKIRKAAEHVCGPQYCINHSSQHVTQYKDNQKDLYDLSMDLIDDVETFKELAVTLRSPTANAALEQLLLCVSSTI